MADSCDLCCDSHGKPRADVEHSGVVLVEVVMAGRVTWVCSICYRDLLGKERKK